VKPEEDLSILSKKRMNKFLLSWGFVILSAICDCYAAYVVKLKLNELSIGHLKPLKMILTFIVYLCGSPLLISGVIAFALAPFLWFLGLSRLQLSSAYPVNVCMHLLLIFVVSTFFLGEAITARKVTGAVLLMASIYLFFKS
jgi:drug/metabolite transporter (DMT)-like permease